MTQAHLSDFRAPVTRRHDLDGIRIGAFGLLILYHLGMVYVPWGFHVNSDRPQAWLEPLMWFTNPWRMSLLFLISGAATRLLLQSYQAQGPGAAERLAGSRMLRLFLPLLFGMLVIVPPQTYFQVLELARLGTLNLEAQPTNPVADFWVRYTTSTGNWCEGDKCIITPTWNHLWFLAYVLIYGLIAAMVAGAAGAHIDKWSRALDRALSGVGLIAWPVAVLALYRLWLYPLFPITHDLFGDLYNHALSLSAFGFGFLMVGAPQLTERLRHHRHGFLALALISYAAFVTYMIVSRNGPPPPEALKQAMRVVLSVDQWAFIAAVLGYGAHHLGRPNRLMAYLGGGIFCFYIVHQTLIIVSFALLAPLRLPLIIEAGAVLLATVIGCLATYELVRRLGVLGLLLGVSPAKRKLSSPRQTDVTAALSPNLKVKP